MTVLLSWNGILHRKLCGLRSVYLVLIVPPGEEIVGFLYGPGSGRRCRRCWR